MQLTKTLITKKAAEAIRNLRGSDQKWIQNKINYLQQHAFPKHDCSLDIKKLLGFDNLFRLRVGSFRIIFKFENETFIIVDILDRKDAYRQF